MRYVIFALLGVALVLQLLATGIVNVILTLILPLGCGFLLGYWAQGKHFVISPPTSTPKTSTTRKVKR